MTIVPETKQEYLFRNHEGRLQRDEIGRAPPLEPRILASRDRALIPRKSS